MTMEEKIDWLMNSFMKMQEKVDSLTNSFMKMQEKVDSLVGMQEKVDSLMTMQEKFDVLVEKVEKLEEDVKDIKESRNSMHRTLLLIQDDTSNKIPALFDGYSFHQQHIEEDEKRLDVLENVVDEHSIRISALEQVN